VQIVQAIFGFCDMKAVGLDLLLPNDQSSAKEGLQRAFDIGRLVASE
jgi:hypothetical protein